MSKQTEESTQEPSGNGKRKLMSVEQLRQHGARKLAEAPENTVAAYLATRRGRIEKLLPRHMDADRLMALAMTALQRPELGNCSIESLFGSLIEASKLGLEPESPLGHCYLVPYANKCQLQIGYQGLVELALRSGKVSKIDTGIVYENEPFRYARRGADIVLDHDFLPPSQRGAPIAYYAVARLDNGDVKAHVMWPEEAAEIRDKFSKGAWYYDKREGVRKPKDGHPWWQHFDAMAIKSAIIRLAKTLPKSPQLARAVQLDGSAEAGEQQLDQIIEGEFRRVESIAGGPAEAASERPEPDPAAEAEPPPALDGLLPVTDPETQERADGFAAVSLLIGEYRSTGNAGLLQAARQYAKRAGEQQIMAEQLIAQATRSTAAKARQRPAKQESQS